MEDLTKVLNMKRIQYYVNYQQDNWTKWLSAAEFQYNNKKYTATGYTLFKLNFE